MAEDESNTTEEGGEDQGEQVIPPPEHVTRPQWAAMFALAGALVYLYVIWPQWVSGSDEDLKDSKVYFAAAQASFEAAHTDRAFPRDLRINTFQDVHWQYSQARKAKGSFALEDVYRWGYASLQGATTLYPGSRYAMVRPLELFEEARSMIRMEEERCKADGLNALEVEKALSDLPVHPAKVDFVLAMAYLEVGRVDKAIPLLENLQILRHRYEQSKRLKGGAKAQHFSGVVLGASPYLLQLQELNQVGWMLGKALHLLGRTQDAITALDAFLESTRPIGTQDDATDREIRFEALKLLSEIHLSEVHHQERLLRKLRGDLEGGPTAQIAYDKKLEHLEGAYRRLKELYEPEYLVYGFSEQPLMFAEVCVKSKRVQEAMDTAESFQSADPHKRNEMKLWGIQAQLMRSKDALVIPILQTIAGDNTRRSLRLAAWVMMGDLQVDRDQVDKTLGLLLESNKGRLYLASVGAYQKAASTFEEKEFDENTMIDKFTLIESFMKRAHRAEREGNEDLAIRIYRFLLQKFTVQKASMIQGVAKLQRVKGMKLVKQHGELTPEAKNWFNESAESYLFTHDNPKVPFEKLASEEALYQAAESYFDGGFYSKAYDYYARFMAERPEDARVSKARHKRGVSALYRKGYKVVKEYGPEGMTLVKKPHDRFGDARREFIINISNSVRNIDGGNGELEVNPMVDSEKSQLDELLSKDEIGARDIWAYNSLLELGNAFYAEHRYEEAAKVYSRIRRDGRFSPRSEVWRKAAYQQVKMTWDRVSESGENAPWREAVKECEDLLMLYDLSTYSSRFSMNDEELYETFQRENAHVKFLLIRALLKQKDAAEALVHARELLEDGERFELSIQDGKTENDQLATRQKAEALCGDAYYATGDFERALEHYRRAHDRHLDSLERPFYSLNMVDCLVAMGEREKAIIKLKQIKWEFEKFFDRFEKIKSASDIYQDDQTFTREAWIELVDNRLALLLANNGS